MGRSATGAASRTFVLAMALVVMLTATSCSSSRESAGRRIADQHFVDGVHASATDVSQYQTDGQLVKLGHATCDAFRAKADNEQVAGLLERTGGANLPPEDLGAIMSSAVKNLCPTYAAQLNPVGPGG